MFLLPLVLSLQKKGVLCIARLSDTFVFQVELMSPRSGPLETLTRFALDSTTCTV